jgi:hypothetical protein
MHHHTLHMTLYNRACFKCLIFAVCQLSTKIGPLKNPAIQYSLVNSILLCRDDCVHLVIALILLSINIIIEVANTSIQWRLYNNKEG